MPSNYKRIKRSIKTNFHLQINNAPNITAKLQCMYPLTKKILSSYSHIHGNRYTHISLHTVKSSFTGRRTTYLEPPEVEYLRHGRNGRRTNFPQRQLQRGRRKHHNQWRRNLESFQGGNLDVVFLLHMSLLNKKLFYFQKSIYHETFLQTLNNSTPRLI